MVNSKKSKKQKADITEFGLNKIQSESDIAESLRQNKKNHSKTKRKSLEKSIQISKSSAILDQDLILNDQGLNPYWNDACLEMQSKLWSPQEIDLQDQDYRLLNGQSNYTEGLSTNWKRIVAKNNSTHQNLSVLLQVSSQVITEKEVVIARKVRIYPENESLWNKACSLHRRAYNLSIEEIKKGNADWTVVKKTVREKIRLERIEKENVFISVVCDEAVNLAFNTFKNCLRKWKKGEKCELRFRSKKEVRQGFWCQRCSNGGQIYPKNLGKCHITENLDESVKGQTVKVTIERGRWFVSYKEKILLSDNQAGNKLVSIDQGIRSFVTSFSLDNCVKYGENLKNELGILYGKIDYWKSIRDKLPKLDVQWVKDRQKWCNRKINTLSNRMHDLIDDIHWKVAFDLVKDYDIILLPKFETSNMIKKNGRKIKKGTARLLSSMSFYKFSTRLAWLCKKYGKTLIIVNEAYTSKTDSRTGEIKDIGGSKKINGLDRDVNGARGIMLRALTR